MKKGYIVPELEVIEGELQSSFCLSLEVKKEENTSIMNSIQDIEFEEN